AQDQMWQGQVALYHGKMENHDRKSVMDSFCCKHDSGPQKHPIDPPPNIILCTNAFGLGVDKGDICSVILLGLPMSINELVQQSGRAHRDPKKVKLTTGVDG